jgi:hypothetical protein
MRRGAKKAPFHRRRPVARRLLPSKVSATRSEEEEMTMLPGAFPMLPALVFPTMLVPSISDVTVGLSAVDVTAAVAAVVWALCGVVALRIAVIMSRDRGAARSTPEPASPPEHRNRFRDAA